MRAGTLEVRTTWTDGRTRPMDCALPRRPVEAALLQSPHGHCAGRLHPRRGNRRPHAGPAAGARTPARRAGGRRPPPRGTRRARLCAQRRLARSCSSRCAPGPTKPMRRPCWAWRCTATKAARCGSTPAAGSRRWPGSSTCRRCEQRLAEALALPAAGDRARRARPRRRSPWSAKAAPAPPAPSSASQFDVASLSASTPSPRGCTCERPHGHVARQWFANGEVLALLPLGGQTAGRGQPLGRPGLVRRSRSARAAAGTATRPRSRRLVEAGCHGALGSMHAGQRARRLAAAAGPRRSLVRSRLGAGRRRRAHRASAGGPGPEPGPGRCPGAGAGPARARVLARPGRRAAAAPLRARAQGRRAGHGRGHRRPAAAVRAEPCRPGRRCATGACAASMQRAR